jgi:hypothetical protein
MCRRSLGAVAIVAALFVVRATDVSAAGFCDPGVAPKYQFGFAVLRSLVGDVMGEPLECEHANNSNGDTLQATSTGGLAFYRKSTNTPTFTDGVTHWGLTDNGLVTWTGSSIDPPGVTPPPRTPPTEAPVAAARPLGRPETCLSVVESRFMSDLPRGWSRTYEVIDGTVRNTCQVLVGPPAAIRLSRLSRLPTGGDNVMELPNAWTALGGFGIGESRPFQIPLVGLPSGSGFLYWAFAFNGNQTLGPPLGLPCWNLEPSVCIVTDARLGIPVADLLEQERGRWLLTDAAKWNVDVRLSHLSVGTLGQYDSGVRTIWIDDRMLAYGAREVAAVMAHELQHAADDAAGKLGAGNTCYANEEDAFRREGELWSAMWSGRLPAPQNSIQSELNDISLLAGRDPYRLISKYLASYGHQCS